MPKAEKTNIALRAVKAALAPVTRDFWLKAAALAIAIAIYALLSPEKKNASAAPQRSLPPEPEIFPLNSPAAPPAPAQRAKSATAATDGKKAAGAKKK